MKTKDKWLLVVRGKASSSHTMSATHLSPDCKFEVLEHGVVLVRAAFTPGVQAALVDGLLAGTARKEDKAELLDPTDGSPPRRYTQLCTWKWPSRYGAVMTEDQPSEAPAGVLAAAVEVCRGAAAACGGRVPPCGVPPGFKPDCVRCVAYPEGGVMLAHTDQFMGSTLSLSFGGGCRFAWGFGYDGDGALLGRQEVHLESGDAVLFDGQALPHAVEGVDASALPSWWVPAGDPASTRLRKAAARINCQIRDSRVIARYGK